METKYYKSKSNRLTYRYKTKFEYWHRYNLEWRESCLCRENPTELMATIKLSEVKPELVSCKKCNNNGCRKCEKNPFSIWNKFHVKD